MGKRTRRQGLAGALALTVGLAASPALAEPNTGKISLSLGTDITTAYFFRGIIQEREGLIAQPYGEVGINLYKGSGAVSDVSLLGGMWHSIHSKQTGQSASSLDVLYESDFYGGVSVGLFDDLLTSSVSYVFYTSPNDAFATVQEVDIGASIDDSKWLGPWALNPSALFAVEVENTAFGPDQGQYLELGVEPGFTLIESDTYPVSVSFPQTLGLGLNDYYEVSSSDDDTFGYFSTGVSAEIPLAFIPEDYGSWSATGGVQFLALGGNTGAANAEHRWVVGTWGISMTY